MNATIGDALILGVGKITEVISSIAPEAWRIMIRQQYVEVGAMVFGFIVCLVYLFIAHKKIPKVKKNSDDAPYSDDGWTFLLILMWIIVVIAILVIIPLGTNLILHLINPEYYALQALMQLVS